MTCCKNGQVTTVLSAEYSEMVLKDERTKMPIIAIRQYKTKNVL